MATTRWPKWYAIPYGEKLHLSILVYYSIFGQDNAPCHRTILVTSYMADRGIKLVQNSTSNPELPLCDFFFLPDMKDSMMGTQTGN